MVTMIKKLETLLKPLDNIVNIDDMNVPTGKIFKKVLIFECLEKALLYLKIYI